jgi:hypothetical protein
MPSRGRPRGSKAGMTVKKVPVDARANAITTLATLAQDESQPIEVRTAAAQALAQALKPTPVAPQARTRVSADTGPALESDSIDFDFFADTPPVPAVPVVLTPEQLAEKDAEKVKAAEDAEARRTADAEKAKDQREQIIATEKYQRALALGTVEGTMAAEMLAILFKKRGWPLPEPAAPTPKDVPAPAPYVPYFSSPKGKDALPRNLVIGPDGYTASQDMWEDQSRFRAPQFFPPGNASESKPDNWRPDPAIWGRPDPELQSN